MDMKRLSGLTAALLACAAAGSAHASTIGPIVGPVVIPQDYTFTFTGACSDCTGFGIGELKLTNYELGTDFDSSNFVSFSYKGTNKLGAYQITADGAYDAYGNIDKTPGFYDVHINGYSNFFDSYTDGTWATGEAREVDDYGTDGLWSLGAVVVDPTTPAVPEPATWAMMLVGFGVVGAAARRRKVSTSVTYA